MFAVGCVISFSWWWAPCCSFVFVFSLLFGLFWVPGVHGGRGGQKLVTADWGLITAAGETMRADGKLITGAGKANDSGRGGFLCAVGVFSFFVKAILSFFDF